MYAGFFQVFIVLVCVGDFGAQKIPGIAAAMAINATAQNEIIISDISGTPYFNETYKFANIKFKSGREFINVKTRINLLIQAVSFISSNGIEINMDPGTVKEITYTDTTTDGIIAYKFQTGFPAIDKQKGDNFYLIMAEGRCNLIKSILKTISERTNVVYGERVGDFATLENYYFFVKGEMKKIRKDKNFILTELSDKQALLTQFIISNKLNIKNDEELAKLITYYNTL